MQGRGVDISTSATERGTLHLIAELGKLWRSVASQGNSYTDERSTMKQVAEQTGGEAFLGTNDLKRAMQRSMEDGSTYYTLAYTPDKSRSPNRVPSHRSQGRSARRKARLPSRLLLFTPKGGTCGNGRCRAARRAAARNAAIDHAVLHRVRAAARR